MVNGRYVLGMVNKVGDERVNRCQNPPESERLSLEVGLWLVWCCSKVRIDKGCIATSFATSGTDKICGGITVSVMHACPG